MLGANGAAGSALGVVSTRVDKLGAPCANGASGLRIIKEIMKHAINVLDS
jgi:hypothetical protein